MLTKYHLFLRAENSPEPPTIININNTNVISLAKFSRFMDLPKHVRFMVYEYLLERRIKPMAYPDQGIAYEVITIDPAIARASRQLMDEAQVATPKQRLGEPLVLYMMNAFSFVGDLSRTLFKAYESGQRYILRQGIDAHVLARTDVANVSLIVPTETLLRVFQYAARNSYFRGHSTFNLKRPKSLIRTYFEFAVMKLRHSTHVECRFLVYGRKFNNIEFKHQRAEYVHEDVGWRRESQCNFVLVSDCQATQEFVPETKLPKAGDRPFRELGRPDERAYMRATLYRW